MSLFAPRADPSRVTLSTNDGIAHLRLVDEPNDNALSTELVAALLHGLETIARDADIKVVVLSGSSATFCSGASRRILEELHDAKLPPTELVLAKRILDLPVPVIGAAEGAAIGGGLALLYACDLIVLAEDGRYGANFLSLGITPGMGITTLLEHALSPTKAHELLYTARLYRGRDLAGTVVPADEVLATAEDLAFDIAGHDGKAVRLLKRSLTLPRRRALEEAYTLEALMHETSLATLDLSTYGGPR